ncbi:HAD family hydrolase [Actinomadura sp. KC216]|uniref:HAD family hydrolase n=1 Tax=Actinomadura sp. KC216 TaxID=2530370 RepID=UPI001405374C|nr:HAD family hydrolase [Actinomadura sp. KC216]
MRRHDDGGIGVQAVVFDLDGTLVDTMTSLPEAYVAAIAELGGPELTVDELVGMWHLGPAPALLAHILGRAVTDDETERLYEHAAAAVESARPFPGVRELLRALRDDGVLLAVYTSATRRIADPMLAGSGLDGYFPVVVTGDQVADPKPAPDGLLHACRLLGVSASETAYVGDSETDLGCARAAGAAPVHARWSASSRSGHHPPAAYRPADVITVLSARRPLCEGSP